MRTRGQHRRKRRVIVILVAVSLLLCAAFITVFVIGLGAFGMIDRYAGTYTPRPGWYGAAATWDGVKASAEGHGLSTETTIPASLPASEAIPLIGEIHPPVAPQGVSDSYGNTAGSASDRPHLNVSFFVEECRLASGTAPLWDRLRPTGIYDAYMLAPDYKAFFFAKRGPSGRGVWEYAYVGGRDAASWTGGPDGQPYLWAVQEASREASSFEVRILTPGGDEGSSSADAKGAALSPAWLVFRFPSGAVKVAAMYTYRGLLPSNSGLQETFVDGKRLDQGRLYPPATLSSPFTIARLRGDRRPYTR